MKNEKLLEICFALGPRKRRKATEAGSATAKTSITYNSLKFGQLNKVSKLQDSARIGLKFAYTKLSHASYEQEVIQLQNLQRGISILIRCLVMVILTYYQSEDRILSFKVIYQPRVYSVIYQITDYDRGLKASPLTQAYISNLETPVQSAA